MYCKIRKRAIKPMYATIAKCLVLLLCGICIVPAAMADEGKKPVDRVRLVMPSNASPVIKNIAAVFVRQVTQRCAAKVVTSGDAPLIVELALAPDIGSEGFRIEDRPAGGVRIVGNDDRGILYGVGKFLRTSRYDQGGFTSGMWRGTSVPQKPVRGIYFATHFHNFYHDAPVEKIQRYVEDQGLWGCNTIIVWYDMHHFNGFEDPQAVAFRQRLKQILQTAREIGLDVATGLLGNEAYANSPVKLRADPKGGRGGYYQVAVCPNKPGGMEYILKVVGDYFDYMQDLEPRYMWIWPYDQGGCGCKECMPWGTNGFLKCAKNISRIIREKFPNTKIVLSTWYFDESEWQALDKVFAENKPFADYILADSHSGYPRYPLENGVPGNLPLLNFPEISMHGHVPYGGFGANPLPSRFQKIWDEAKDKLSGGFPYSEGIYEDINKIIALQFYWNPKTTSEKTVKEYIGFEYSPNVVNDVWGAVLLVESNHPRVSISSTSVEAFAIMDRINDKLSTQAKNSWRWRLLYLRSLIDKEMYKNEGLKGPLLKEAFMELTEIYHAQNADKVWLRPPTHRVEE
jgi:hypothetical protein